MFITFEGGEGVGKSTQARLLTERLSAAGRKVVSVHEPGGTLLGDYIRRWVKSQSAPLTSEAELLLFTASRAELVRRVIRPSLDDGAIVIADRYADSTTVYQGYGRQLPLSQVAEVNGFATGGLEPSLTVLLDAPPEAALQRARVQASFDDKGRIDPVPRAEDSDKRRFEDLSALFHQRVRDGFLRLARRSPKRWLVLDALEPELVVHAHVWERVERELRAAG